MLKQEHIVKNAYFLAPKCYTLLTNTGDVIIKHKGIANELVDYEWFVSQYADLSRIKQGVVESSFRIDWHTLQIAKKYLHVNLGIKVDNKRVPLYDENKKWIDTEPKYVSDFGGEDSTILKYELKKLLHQNACMQSEMDILKSNAKERDQLVARMESEIDQLRLKDHEKTKLIADLNNNIDRFESIINSQRVSIISNSTDNHQEEVVKHPPTVSKEGSNYNAKDSTSMTPKYNATIDGYKTPKRNKRRKKR